MDPITQQTILAAAGAGGDKVYVDDVFSTFAYKGNGTAQRINNGIALADGLAIDIGTPLGGGFFAGFISHTANGTATHALIVAPKATGTDYLHYKTSNTSSSGTTSTYDGAANSAAMNNSNHPAAQFCEALSIGGFTDWYLPARYELDIAYYNCKPTSPTNNTSFGVNDYSVPKYTINRTNQFPLESIAERFRINGGEDFIQDYYWSSTSTLSGTAVAFGFYNGYIYEKDKNVGSDVRAFRKIAINDSSLDDYRVIGEGGLVWMKCRTGVENNILVDTERGVNKGLVSNSNTSGYNNVNLLPSFNPDGFTTKQNGATNSGGQDYVSWTFRKQKGFFDIVTWNASSLPSDYLVAHNLGSVPGMIICKNISAANDWQVYHRSATSSSSTDPNAHFLQLNKTNASTYSSGMSSASGGWAVSSTHFRAVPSLGLDNGSDNFVAYVFAHDAAQFGTAGNESIIKCGSYTATGSLQEIDLGFEPQWVMIKNSSRSSNPATNWVMFDSMRGMYSDQDAPYLYPNLSSTAGAGKVGVSATGLVIDEATVPIGISGDTYTYMAIRRPNKPPEVGTDVFAVDTGGNNPNVSTFMSGFPVDFAFERSNITQGGSQTSYYPMAVSRLQGQKKIWTSGQNINVEIADSNIVFDSNTGYAKGFSASDIAWMFKRAPGFMDVVAYTGDGTGNHAVPHNLGVAPELLIVKHRTAATRDWHVYTQPTGATSDMRLNQSNAATTGFTYWANTTPTATHFYVSNVPPGDIVNQNNSPFLALLFATLPGISKVGSYNGTGNAVNVDCGFTNGSRFVLIKRTNGGGDWYVWDSVRGIVSGNDPYLHLNNSTAQVSNTDYIDPLSTGFTVTASAPQPLNTNGGTYLFLAIA